MSNSNYQPISNVNNWVCSSNVTPSLSNPYSNFYSDYDGMFAYLSNGTIARLVDTSNVKVPGNVCSNLVIDSNNMSKYQQQVCSNAEYGNGVSWCYSSIPIVGNLDASKINTVVDKSGFEWTCGHVRGIPHALRYTEKGQLACAASSNGNLSPATVGTNTPLCKSYETQATCETDVTNYTMWKPIQECQSTPADTNSNSLCYLGTSFVPQPQNGFFKTPPPTYTSMYNLSQYAPKSTKPNPNTSVLNYSQWMLHPFFYFIVAAIIVIVLFCLFLAFRSSGKKSSSGEGGDAAGSDAGHYRYR